MKTKNFRCQNPRRIRAAENLKRKVAVLTGFALTAGLAGLPGVAAASAIADCVAIQDATERLACFDRLARAEGAAPPPPTAAAAPQPENPASQAKAPEPAAGESAPRDPAPTAPAVTAPANAETTPRAAPEAAGTADEDSFGLERMRELEGAASIEANVIGGFRGWYGDTVFELDNGQTWEQVGSSRFRYGGPDRKVEISRAAFGSFRLSPEGLNSKVRVRRKD